MHCFQREKRKCGGWVSDMPEFQAGRSLRGGQPSSKTAQWDAAAGGGAPTPCSVPSPRGCRAKPAWWLGRTHVLCPVNLPFLSAASHAIQWAALFQGKNKMFAWPKMNFKVLNSSISHDKWGVFDLMPLIYFHIYVLTVKQTRAHTTKFCCPLVFHMNEIIYFQLQVPGNLSKFYFKLK